MKKREIVSSIIIVVMFVLVMLCIAKTTDIGRRLSELEVDPQRFCNVSVSVTCVSAPPLREGAINPTNPDIERNHLQADNLRGFATDSGNVTYPLICGSQWLENAITVEEILNCVEDYMNTEQLKMRGEQA